jgi:alkanesulfonate monooxygenase SsuD/methylene tetrahydromethanopterin reductase-like flavin-dependent oxidoreductase (luciferase family)
MFAAIALGLAGCGSSSKDQQAASYCPPPLTVQDAQSLTRFKEGAGRDPRDVMFEASLVAADTKCQVRRNKLDVDVTLRIAVNAGPSVGTGVTRVPFFVRVIDANGTVVQGSDQFADYKISATSPRGLSQEEMAVGLPYSSLSDLGGYRIAVGLKPSQQELDYNRRSGAR